MRGPASGHPISLGSTLNIVAIVQARMGSTRLPGKVMRPIGGVPMIGRLLERLSRAASIDDIVVATTDGADDEPLAEYVHRLGYRVFRGSRTDVLDRYYQAAQLTRADAVVRVTGDCPLIDPALVDTVVRTFVDEGVDYAANIAPPTFPDGLDTEVFNRRSLETAWREATAPGHREHVTAFIRESAQFRRANVAHATDYSAERWTVDEPEDLEVVVKVFDHFSPRPDFSWLEVLALRHRHPEWFGGNRHLTRDDGARIATGQKLWKRARRVIPGGNMLLSKRPEMFLPEQWPAYFSRAKGCRVWDLDGREYVDMSLMGVGTNVLGYGHPQVDAAVVSAINAGNMSTLNCPEEVELAERLIAIHPWAEMVRLTRSGGEANAVAVRIARAASGRDTVAVCGYHGWHDWYLAANLGDDQRLAGHLLPGLEPNGVPRALRGTVQPFTYGRFDELEALVGSHDVGVVKMEVSRTTEPDAEFLRQVRRLCSDKGIVLIFDECTSGFRETFGGVHLRFGVEPDMALFGKALGNGYAIAAAIGRRSVMEAAQSTFISSTFWTERIGPTAALKTLDVMARERSWERIRATGVDIGQRWLALARTCDLPLALHGLPSLIGFSLSLPDALKCKTLITQEMLKRGFLAATSVYVCTAHTQAEVDAYFDALAEVFALLRCCMLEGSIDDCLQGPVCHPGFKRLN